MRYLLVLVISLCLASKSLAGWWKVSDTKAAPNVIYSWLGFPTTDGTPNTPTNGWAGYGSTGDRIYTREILPADHSGGTAVSINLHFQNALSADNIYGCLYKGTTLIGKGLITSTTSSTWSEVVLSATPGQSLSFLTSDTLYAGWCVDAGTTWNFTGRDSAQTAITNYSSTAWATNPPSTITWTTSSNSGLGVVLKISN